MDMSRAKAAVVGLVVLAMVGSASAGIHTSKPLGPLELLIGPDDTAGIVNMGAVPFTIDGYTILSESAALSPSGWVPISEGFIYPQEPWLGFWIPPLPPEFSWAVLSRTTSILSEATLSTGITLQPGAIIPMGSPAPGGTQADLTFTYVDAAAGGGSWEGRVVPEPASMVMIGSLGAGLLIMRRRRKKM